MENPATDQATLNPSRRSFLLTASAAAAVGLTLVDTPLSAAQASGQAGAPAGVQLFTAASLDGQISAMHQTPANKTIVTDKSFVVILTVETARSAKEFEYHEGRDHIFHVLDGSTMYEVGGTPKGAHATGPGEWLAPESEGAVSYTLGKGDIFVVPRGTPHKRITKDTVTLLLVSPMGAPKA